MENEVCIQPEKCSEQQNLNQEELALLAALRKNPVKFRQVLTLLQSGGRRLEDLETLPGTEKATPPLPE